MPTKYVVRLTPSDRAHLKALLHRGAVPAQRATRIRILLKADRNATGPALTDRVIAEAVETSVSCVERTRRAFVTSGLEQTLRRARPTRTRARRLDGDGEARLVLLACSTPPAGHDRWSLRLLASRLVELEIVPGIAPETVRQTLKKTPCSPTGAGSGV